MKHRSLYTFSVFFGILAAFFITTSIPGTAFSENVKLITEDGYTIAATLNRPETKPAKPAGAILIHMYRSTKESWTPLTRVLTDHGITTLAIDLRGHGESRIAPDGSDDSVKVLNRDHQFFNTMHLDAQAALKYLKEKELITADRIVLVGASVGCSIAIRTAIDHPVAGVVVMTPGRDYLGIPTMEHIKKWPDIPLLILTSKEEAGRGAEDIYAALQNSDAQLMVFPEEGIHGTNMFGEVENVEQTIADWLLDVLHQ